MRMGPTKVGDGEKAEEGNFVREVGISSANLKAQLFAVHMVVVAHATSTCATEKETHTCAPSVVASASRWWLAMVSKPLQQSRKSRAQCAGVDIYGVGGARGRMKGHHGCR